MFKRNVKDSKAVHNLRNLWHILTTKIQFFKLVGLSDVAEACNPINQISVTPTINNAE